jgi:hypothetical protein
MEEGNAGRNRITVKMYKVMHGDTALFVPAQTWRINKHEKSGIDGA